MNIPKPALLAAVTLSFAPVSCDVPSLNTIAASVSGSEQPRQPTDQHNFYGGNVRPPEGLEQYGVNGQLNTTQLDTLFGLDFSRGQSYHAMKNALGFPKYRDGNHDYYQIGSSNWVVVNYRSDGKAFGYEVGDNTY